MQETEKNKTINSMKVVIIGSGYVGLVTGGCFADMGVDVCCVDIDKAKVERLSKGVVPIYEPELQSIVERNLHAGRLSFASSAEECMEGVDAVFIAVGTPPGEDGSADVSYVLEAARSIGRSLTGYAVVTVKSTVPVGTTAKVKAVIAEQLRERGVDIEFDVASNPEFLKEGRAVRDFMMPDRVVVGVESERARALMRTLYSPLMMTDRLLFTDVVTAEMTKYAANAMLATRISFMNDIANLCELTGADVNMVRKGIGADARIGSKFLYAGCGYGGSCFPKDVRALIATAEKLGYSMEVVKAVERVNNRQKRILFEKLNRHFDGNLQGKTIAVWGLSFKPDTDDLREAPSLVLIDSLLEAGCCVKVFDPVAMDNAQAMYGDRLIYTHNIYEAATDADALAVVTEWKEFRLPAWATLQRVMRGRVIADGRNIYSGEVLREMGFTYYKIG